MRLLSIAVCALATLLTGAPAYAHALRTPHVESELVSSKSVIAPGERFTIAFRQRIIPGWHTYWVNAGDSGEPVTLTWRLPAGFQAGELRHPPPVTERVQTVMTYVHKGEVLFPAELRAPATLRPGDTTTLAAHVFYLVCSDICLTEEGDVSITLPVGVTSRPDLNWVHRLEDALESIPQNEGWPAHISAGTPARLSVTSEALAEAARAGRLRDIGFFPFEREVVRHAAAQNPSFGPMGVTFSLEPGPKRNLGETDLAGVIAFDERSPRGWVRRGVEIRAIPGAPLAETGD